MGNGTELINKLLERVMSMNQLIGVLESLKGVISALAEKVVSSTENSSKANEKLSEQFASVVKAVDGFENSLKAFTDKLPNKEDLNQDCNECALLKERSKTVSLLKKWLIAVAVTLFGTMAAVAGLKITGIIGALLQR